MGVPPFQQGKLYFFQINSLIDEYHENKKFMAQTGGMNIG